MKMNKETIANRYALGYVTDVQLLRYVKLDAITMEEAREIQKLREMHKEV